MMKHDEFCKISSQSRLIVEEAMLRLPAKVRGISGLAYYPWIGKRFFDEPSATEGKRILLLGESHYEWCEACRLEGSPRDHDLTCRSIAERVSFDPAAEGMAHWTKIENAVFGEMIGFNKTRRLGWDHVAYFNYVQEMVGFGSRTRPSTEMWKKAERPFLAILEVLRPDVIVVMGFKLWQELPLEDEDIKIDSVNHGGIVIERCAYSIRSGKATIACRVRHPAAGLGQPWAKAIHRAISSDLCCRT